MREANAVFNAAVSPYSPAVRARLAELRKMVLETARETRGVGQVLEALRWGQFSFLTPETGSGSTIRIDGRRDEPNAYAIYFHCQSGLIEEFKFLYPNVFTFEGQRALVFHTQHALPTAELKHCIALALTHHLRKKSAATKTSRAKHAKAPDHHRHGPRPG